MKEEVLIPKRARIVGGTGGGIRRIYILKDAYQKIFTFSKDKNVCQAGGVLLGNIVYEEETVYVIIRDFIEALYCESTSNAITFTKETWAYIDAEKEKYPQFEIVGWMHTNPDTGCGATEYDLFLHSHMFEKDNMVEYIVDPVQIVEAFYFLKDEKLQKSDGFYLFIENNNKKSAKQQQVETEELEVFNPGVISSQVDLSEVQIPERVSLRMKVLVSILTVLVLALAIAVGMMTVRISQLERDIDKLYENDKVIAYYINGVDETTKNINAEEETTSVTEETTSFETSTE